MTVTAESWWDEFYRKEVFSSGKEPSAFLQHMIHRMRRGKTLDLAMGEGVNATYLAQKGFEVRGFDVSGIAVERAKILARDSGVTLDAKKLDLDLFLFNVMEYDSIVMTFFKPPVVRYYTEIIRGLKQGGTLLIESYLINEQKEGLAKNESYRNYFYFPNELLRSLGDLRILFYHEGLEDDRHVVQCLAMKPLDKDAVKYNLFDMHTKQKETPVSPHMKLAEALFKKDKKD